MPITKQGRHWYLTDDEISEIRAEFDRARSPESYKPGRWYVSALNRRPEVLGFALPPTLPESVVVRDITLRTVEQVPGIAISVSERRRLLEAIVASGFRSVNLTVVGRGKIPLEVVRDEIAFVKKSDPGIEIVVIGDDSKEGLNRLRDLGVDTVTLVTHSVVGVVPLYGNGSGALAWERSDWRDERPPARTLAETIAAKQDLVEYAHTIGLEVESMLNNLLYASEDTIREFAQGMHDAGSECIMLADGPSGFTPNAVAYAVDVARKAAPGTDIGVHMHETFNLGVALNMAAVQAGASLVEGSINGYCGGPGQTDVQQLVAAFEILYGINTGVDMTMLTELRRLGEDVTRMPVGVSHPITGEQTFNVGGADDINLEPPVDPLLHLCFDPQVVGNQRWFGWVLDRTSGNWSILEAMTDLGIPVEREEVEGIRQRVYEELLIRKRSLTEEEVRAIAFQVKGEFQRSRGEK